MNNKQAIETIIKKINQYENILIYRHRIPDGDALGSQFGLKEFIKLNFKNKKVFAMGEEKAYSGDFLSDLYPKPDLSKWSGKKALTIVLDCPTKERISGEFYNSKDIIKIDHHPNLDDFETLAWVSTSFSSTCEMIGEIAFSKKTYKLNIGAAKTIFSGIVTDTGRFQFDSTTSNTLKIASQLLTYKFDAFTEIYEKLNNRTLEIIKFQELIVKNTKFDNDVAYCIVPKNSHKKLKVSFEEASAQVNTITSIKGVNYALYAIFDSNKNNWKISLRSKKKAINVIAEMNGGGGHSKASGIKVDSIADVNKVLKQLIKLRNENN